MLKRFNLSRISLSNAEIASLSGFDVDLHNALICFGIRQETVNTMQLEFVRNMGILCVLLSASVTNKVVLEDWQFTQHSLLYVENRKKKLKVFFRNGTEHTYTNVEFCFSIALMACQENMVKAVRDELKDSYRISYFYYHYLKACLNKIPISEANLKKVNLFIESNKSLEFKLIEENIHLVFSTIE